MGKYFLFRDGVARILTETTEEEAIIVAEKEKENFPGLKVELFCETEYGTLEIGYKDNNGEKEE